ncbi:MAG: glucose/sorbosone dehydrogenase [bacterium]
MHRTLRAFLCLFLFLITVDAQTAGSSNARGPKLTPHTVSIAASSKFPGGKTFELNLPDGFDITIAAQGLKRVRFMAQSPDGRIFVTDMYNLADNNRGVVYILDNFDQTSKRFQKVTRYLTGLRNPNSIAFHTDREGVSWLYLALTDHLLRYRYKAADAAPTGQPEVLASFPDYGLSYKYGGWHLTRTVVVGGNGKIYVAVGSSCNACEEKEAVRASIIEMDPDGQNQKRFASGLRNAVGLRWIKDGLVATNMGSDHLGDHKPADTMYLVRENSNYGWPYCYQSGPRRFPDPKFNATGQKLNCGEVPAAYVAFDAHSSPLGFEYFDKRAPAEVSESFLVALHGSTKKSLKRGYRVVRVRDGAGHSHQPEDFLTGFLKGTDLSGRPVDILQFGENGFLLTDDYAGVVYYVYKK